MFHLFSQVDQLQYVLFRLDLDINLFFPIQSTETNTTWRALYNSYNEANHCRSHLTPEQAGNTC